MRQIINFRNSLRRKAAFNPCQIVTEYLDFAARNQTFRSVCPKKSEVKVFGLRERTGIHATGKTNRKEEALCQGLFNSFFDKVLPLPCFGQKIVDYQTPLKNVQGNSLWGKIDLVGMITGSPKKHLCFWELKLAENHDSIHYSVMELLIYLAQFDFANAQDPRAEGNYENFLRELGLVRGANVNNLTIRLKRCLPILFLAGEPGFFAQNDFQKRRKEYQALIGEIQSRLKVTLKFLEMESGVDYSETSKEFQYSSSNKFQFLL